MVSNQIMLSNRIEDTTAAMLSDSAMKMNRRLCRSLLIINRARVDIFRINTTLYYADALSDMSLTWWERFELNRTFNIVSFVFIGLNTMLALISMKISTVLCAKC